MRQTRKAITFLLAQYRAIMHNAALHRVAVLLPLVSSFLLAPPVAQASLPAFDAAFIENNGQELSGTINVSDASFSSFAIDQNTSNTGTFTVDVATDGLSLQATTMTPNAQWRFHNEVDIGSRLGSNNPAGTLTADSVTLSEGSSSIVYVTSTDQGQSFLDANSITIEGQRILFLTASDNYDAVIGSVDPEERHAKITLSQPGAILNLQGSASKAARVHADTISLKPQTYLNFSTQNNAQDDAVFNNAVSVNRLVLQGAEPLPNPHRPGETIPRATQITTSKLGSGIAAYTNNVRFDIVADSIQLKEYSSIAAFCSEQVSTINARSIELKGPNSFIGNTNSKGLAITAESLQLKESASIILMDARGVPLSLGGTASVGNSITASNILLDGKDSKITFTSILEEETSDLLPFSIAPAPQQTLDLKIANEASIELTQRGNNTIIVNGANGLSLVNKGVLQIGESTGPFVSDNLKDTSLQATKLSLQNESEVNIEQENVSISGISEAEPLSIVVKDKSSLMIDADETNSVSAGSLTVSNQKKEDPSVQASTVSIEGDTVSADIKKIALSDRSEFCVDSYKGTTLKTDDLFVGRQSRVISNDGKTFVLQGSSAPQNGAPYAKSRITLDNGQLLFGMLSKLITVYASDISIDGSDFIPFDSRDPSTVASITIEATNGASFFADSLTLKKAEISIAKGLTLQGYDAYQNTAGETIQSPLTVQMQDGTFSTTGEFILDLKGGSLIATEGSTLYERSGRFGSFTLRDGTFDFAQGSHFYAYKHKRLNSTVPIHVSDKTTLKLFSSDLLTTEVPQDTSLLGINIKSGATVEFKDEKPVDFSALIATDEHYQGKLRLSENSIEACIKAPKLNISSAFTTEANLASATLEAQDLTLGSSSSSQIVHNCGTAQATQSLTIASKDKSDTLKDTVSLVAKDGQQGSIKLAGNAQQLVINADGDNGQLLVKAGNWSTAVDLSLEGDGLVIEGSKRPLEKDPTQQQAVETRFTATGDIVLKNGSVVIGTAKADETIGTATFDASKAQLTLSKGENSSSSDVVTIIGKNQSHILLDADNVEKVFAEQRLRSATTDDSSLLKLKALGKDAVLELTGNEATLHDSDIAQYIDLSNGARLKTQNTLHLISSEKAQPSQESEQQTEASLTLDEGGIFESAVISLKTPEKSTASTIKVSGGDLLVHNELSSSVEHIQFNNTALHLETTEAGAGTVTPSLASDTTLNVIGGWQAKDVTLAGEQAQLIVGTTGEQDVHSPKSDFIVHTLSLNDGATVSVAKDASVTATSLEATKANFILDGHMAVLGDATLPHYGVALNEQTVNVTPTGTFVLGPVAAEAVADFVLQDKAIDPYFGHYAVDGGTLQFQFSDKTVLSSAQYATLRDELATLKNGGTVSIGNAKLGDLEGILDPETKTASWNDIKGVLNNMHSTLQEEVQELVITADGATKGEKTVSLDRAHIGAVALSGDAQLAVNNTDTKAVTVLGAAQKNNNKFVSQGDKAGDVTVMQGGLRLDGSGEIGTISFAKTKEQPFVVLSGPKIVTGDIIGTTADVDQTASGVVTVADKSDMSFGKIENVQALTVGQDVKTTFRDEVKNVQTITAASDLTFNKQASIGSLLAPKDVVTFVLDGIVENAQVKQAIVKTKASFNSLTQKNGDTVVAKRETSQDPAVELTIKKLDSHGGQITADTLIVSEMSLSGNAQVTADVVDLHGFVQVGSDTEGTGSLEAHKISLNGHSILIDPAYSERAAITTIGSFGTASEGTIGSLDGHLIVGQNAIAALGVNSVDEVIHHPELGFIFDERHSLSKQYNAVVYVNDHMSIEPNCSIILDKRPNIGAQYKTVDLGSQPSQLVLGNDTALILNGEKLSADQAYITFKDTAPQIAAAKDAVIFVTPNLATQSFVLFDSAGDIKFKEGDGYNDFVVVSSSNGLFTGKLEAKNGVVDGKVSLGFDEQKAEQILAGVSSPVKQTMIDYFAQSQNAASPDNELIRRSLYNSNGADLETAARFAVYGGAVESSFVVQSSTIEALYDHIYGGENSSITTASNGQGGSLWLTPLYKSHESDGFSAEGVEYGADIDMNGIALGADYTFANGLRIGAAFNIGSGDADGKGAGSNVKNDFDYYSLAAYAAYDWNELSLTADLSYTAIDNDVEGQLQILDEKATASMDSTALTFGVGASYHWDLGGVTAIPYAALRYTSVDLDDYSVKGSTDYASYSAERMDVISLPVGVRLTRDFSVGDWSLSPAFDLTVTANFGDTDAEGTVSWSGGDGLSSKVATEVLDDVTYGAKVGLSAASGNLKLGLGLNYIGSENTNEFGVSAQARWNF